MLKLIKHEFTIKDDKTHKQRIHYDWLPVERKKTRERFIANEDCFTLASSCWKAVKSTICSDSTCFWYNNEIVALAYCILVCYYFVQAGDCAELNHEMNCTEHQQQNM